AMDPAPGTTVGTPPASVVVTFNRPPDAATVTEETFALVASGGDGTFEDGNEAAIAGVVAVEGAEATLDLAGAFLLPNVYQVRLAGGGVADEDGSPLDGEFEADLPSGDGAPGGDFVASFRFGVLPTLSSIQANVFDLHCIQCHLGPAAPRGLQLGAGESFAELVGVASREVPALLLVDPGDPDASYLVRKVEGGPDIVGGQMPLFGDPLDAGTLAAIRQWVADGAEDN
ncbi:MAG: Ig-like domain-containing protein, partial [Candidatus Methylomirabilis sp.]|nr:Ig-like domain-containing protein [Deltaproteobacteria bacterium]